MLPTEFAGRSFDFSKTKSMEEYQPISSIHSAIYQLWLKMASPSKCRPCWFSSRTGGKKPNALLPQERCSSTVQSRNAIRWRNIHRGKITIWTLSSPDHESHVNISMPRKAEPPIRWLWHSAILPRSTLIFFLKDNLLERLAIPLIVSYFAWQLVIGTYDVLYPEVLRTASCRKIWSSWSLKKSKRKKSQEWKSSSNFVIPILEIRTHLGRESSWCIPSRVMDFGRELMGLFIQGAVLLP